MGMNMAETRCNKTYFIAGGRVERTCGEFAEFVCADCGKARCEEHGDESFEEVDGRLLCEDCVPGEPKVGDETPDAKFARIVGEIKANESWRKLLAGEYADEMKALEQIAKQYGGENTATGGGIYVVLIPLGLHDCMGVTAECICRYHSEKATSAYETFWEPDNDKSEGMISLLD